MLQVGYSVYPLLLCPEEEDADMASSGNLPLVGIGITPKAKTTMALWGIMSPEGPCCFQETSALFSQARGEDKDCP